MSNTENWINQSIKEGHIQFITYDSFSNVEAIARGAFGEVSKAWWNSAEKYVALKTLYTDPGSKTTDSFEELVNEFQLIRHVDFHDNVVRFYGLSQEPMTFRYIMVLQYANGGNLREYLRANHATLDWPTKINMGKQIASGLKCIHIQGIVHRDLHSKNILVHDGKMMITDFGLSKNVMGANTNSVVVGMAGYIEPKCFVNRDYKRDTKSDIYSLGVLLWEISSGRPPFIDMSILDIAEQVAKGRREDPMIGTPIDYMNLYKNAWDAEPNRRPDIEEMRNRLDSIRLEPKWNGPDIGDVRNKLDNMRLDASQQKQIQPPQQPPYGPGNAPVQNINYLSNQGMMQGGIGGGYQISNQSGGYPLYNQGGSGYPFNNQSGPNPSGPPMQNPGSGYPNPNQGAGYPNPSHGGYPIQNQGGNYPTQNPMSYPMQDPRMAYAQRPYPNPNYQQSMQMPNPPTTNNVRPNPPYTTQQNYKPPSHPDQPNLPYTPPQNYKPPSHPDQPNTGYVVGVPPSQPPQYFDPRNPQFQQRPNLQ
ncbi:27976_t:CDS:2, partial [Gigaspora margarita]